MLIKERLKQIHGATTRNGNGLSSGRVFHIRTRPAGLLSKPEPGLINFQTFAVFALVVFFLLLFSCYFSIQRLLWEKTQVKFHKKSRGITDNINLLRFIFLFFYFASCSPISLALALFLMIFFLIQRLSS